MGPLSSTYQFSESTKRLAFLAKNSLNIQKLSDIQFDPQIDVSEEANNDLESSIKKGNNILISNVKRKAAENFPYEVQTDLIRITTSREIHHIENVYITPDCRDESFQALTEHINENGRKYKNYLAVGDFNKHYSDKKIQQKYFSSITHLVQQVTKPSREQTRIHKKGQSTSKTLIDH